MSTAQDPSTRTYEQVVAEHRWNVPERLNIATVVCDRWPADKPAMVHEDPDGHVREVDFGEIQSLAARFANVAVDHGVERGDRIAMLLPPTPETAAAFIGTYKAGAVLLSMSVLYGTEGIRHRVADSQARIVVTDTAHEALIREAITGIDPTPAVIVLTPELLAGASDAFTTVDTSSEDPAQLFYTSGTTGLAKGILHAHRFVLGHEEFEYCHELQDGERFRSMAEWAWAAGINPLMGAWRLGAVQYVAQRAGGFSPEAELEFLSRHRITNVFTTPTALRSLMAVESAGERFPIPLRRACSAGEPLNPEAIRWVREQYGITVLDFYGLSEGYPLCANFPFMEVRDGSMGKVMPGWDVQVLDEDERPVAVGERGEICWRRGSSPTWPLGFWNNPDATEETFGGEWFHSKDAARIDEDGYVWFEGRADDVILTAGYRVGPFEVESACLEHDAVAEAAVVAKPDERRGWIVKAFIRVAEGHEPSDELGREISQYVRDTHSAYAYPREVEFVDDLPKTLTGKIRRIELRKLEEERAAGRG
ncbi:MAG: AMP-binding protein [Solirubrobacteraceae bacterium]|nr:AMP-binding protein [Solirubrobacteraceae bacterium]